jgi:cation transport regulator ChaB
MNIELIPKSIKKILPESGQLMFVEAFNKSYAKNKDEVLATKVSWEIVKNKFKQTNTGLVAMSDSFKPKKLFTFQASPVKDVFVSNAENGEIIMDAVLADTNFNTDGFKFRETDLQSLADQINTYGSTLPDVEHETLDVLQRQFTSYPQLVKELQKRKGVFTRIKAAVEDGKLWIKAWLDKRYKNHVEKFKGLSIEALATDDGDGVYKNPKYLGFTFTNTPKLVGATIAS